MRILCAIVEPTANLVPLGCNTDVVHRRRIGPKPIGDDATRNPVLLHDPFEKLHRRGFVPPRGDHGLQHLALMVDGAPQIAELAVDLYKHFIQMPAPQMGRRLTEADRNRIDTAVRGAAYAIIKGKGATWFGVGAGLSRIAQAIEEDERALLTCSMLTPECQGVRDVALSLPRVVGAMGVVKTFRPDLDAGERAALKRSAEILKEAADAVRF